MAKSCDCQVTESDLSREICTLKPTDISTRRKVCFLSVYFKQKRNPRNEPNAIKM